MSKNSAGPRVLIVDDEPLIRWSLAETLGDSGHAVVEAGDGSSAIRSLTAGAAPFDVVLLDYRLPDSDGLGLLSTIRALTPRSVSMMTAFGAPEVTSGALALGAYRVVPKPFEVHEMAGLVVQAHAASVRRACRQGSG